MPKEAINQKNGINLLEMGKEFIKKGAKENGADKLLSAIEILIKIPEENNLEVVITNLVEIINIYISLDLFKKAEKAVLFAKKHHLTSEKRIISVMKLFDQKYQPEPILPQQFLEIQGIIQEAENLDSPNSWVMSGEKYLQAAQLLLNLKQNKAMLLGASQYVTQALSKFLSAMSFSPPCNCRDQIQKTIEFAEINELLNVSEELEKIVRITSRFLS